MNSAQVSDQQGLAVGDQQLAPSNQLPVTSYQSPVTSDQPLIVNNQTSEIVGQQSAQNDQNGIVQAVGQVVQSTSGVSDDKGPEVSYGGDKERVEVIGASEKVPLVELGENAEIEPEVESWIEKLEQAGEVHLPQPVTHDDQVIVADAGAQITQDRVVLPVTLSGQKMNLKKKPEESARWLAVWIERITKIFSGKYRYREEVVGVPASGYAQIPQQETNKATGV